ncbi:small membrane A-kinase anchor protein isoform 3-T5 [Megaptera novaeangliae]
MRLNMRIKKFGTITNEEFRKSPRNSWQRSHHRHVVFMVILKQDTSTVPRMCNCWIITAHRSCQKTVTRNLFKLYRNVSRVTYLSRIRRSGRARGK